MNLEAVLESTLNSLAKTSAGQIPSNLLDSIRYSLLSPGKRIRPRLVLSSARLCGLSEDAACHAAVALEMVHCFTLIHDDLPCMDNDDFRRGVPTNHKVHGEAMALLAGDSLMALAVDALLNAPMIPAERLVAGTRRLSQAMGPRGVIGGQAEEALLSPRSRLEDTERMHSLKTGALFEASVLLPADLVGLDLASPPGRALGEFAAVLGLTFQAADDLEDAHEAVHGVHAPTSVLAHLTPEQVIERGTRRLNQAVEGLISTWGEGARELAHFGMEVGKKLKAAHG